MGDLIAIADWQRARAPRRQGPRVVFLFTLASLRSHLMAERVERELGDVDWQPATGLLPAGEGAPMAMRAAAYAAEAGAGRAFALAAGRLAYCGGFPLDCERTLAEAAAAAGLDAATVLAAADERERDVELAAVGRDLRRAGVGALPAIRFGGVLLHGPDALERAAWLHRRGLPSRAPAG